MRLPVTLVLLAVANMPTRAQPARPADTMHDLQNSELHVFSHRAKLMGRGSPFIFRCIAMVKWLAVHHGPWHSDSWAPKMIRTV